MNNNESRAVETVLTILSCIIILWGVMILLNDKNGLPIILCIGFSTVIFGAICKRIGQARGIKGGFCIGWLLSVIGVFVVLAMPSESNDSLSRDKPDNNSDKYDEIMKIMKLKESGALTEEEFNEEKKKILSK